ncbi:hypothetical protein RBG61_05525 [Paludicola sp. MB14-C6]|uniref:hypothetical protein n=1 Tax=Paludihabitans sp. MB14-C6 TaxID=3070656 RepID=UPI0027DC33EB|nr:hypothetical protein [Paludicola sp. MB14-C6]WMJ24125.1 hypothetical protein RBG61_05525 [Paludicola sp. MB14-C6]
MKKCIHIVITIINITIIALLLFVSISLLYFNANTQKELFGHSAVLYQNNANGNPKKTDLLIIRQNTTIKKGNQVLYYHTNSDNQSVPFVDVVLNTTSSSITLQQSNKTIAIDSPQIKGVVLSKSSFWGGVFAPLTTQAGLLTAMICIVGGFAIIALSIILIYLWKRKKAAISQQPVLPHPIENIESEQKDIPSSHNVEVIESEKTASEEEQSPIMKPRSISSSQGSIRTPLIAARYQNNYRSHSSTLDYSRVQNNTTTTEPKIHEFNTVEELFTYYHTGEIEFEQPPSKSNTETKKDTCPVTEDVTPTPQAAENSIDSLLAEIMEQAEKDYIKEHSDAAIQKYL